MSIRQPEIPKCVICRAQATNLLCYYYCESCFEVIRTRRRRGETEKEAMEWLLEERMMDHLMKSVEES